MFCYFQFLNKDTARQLGSHGESGAIRVHPFFESLDWKAVEERQMEPPREQQIKEVRATMDLGAWLEYLL